MLLNNVFSLLIFLALLVPVYWLIPSQAGRMRDTVLVAGSLAMLALVDRGLPLIPPAALIVVRTFAVARRRGFSTSTLGRLSWLVFIPLPFSEAGLVAGMWGQLGLAFCCLRAFLAIREDLAGKEADPWTVLVSLSFFPTYLAGPVAAPSELARESRASHLSLTDAAAGLARIGWGAALFLVIKPQIVDFGGAMPESGQLAAWRWTIATFLGVYADFYGFTEAAIGVGRLFGMKVPENFRAPLLARSLQDFWNRWHISLAKRVSQYLVKPLTRRIGKPAIAFVLAFVAVGLWHRFTVNYLIWGFGHGAGLGLYLILERWGALSRIPTALRFFGGWAVTLSYVAVLSAIANLPDFASAGRLVGILVGG